MRISYWIISIYAHETSSPWILSEWTSSILSTKLVMSLLRCSFESAISHFFVTLADGLLVFGKKSIPCSVWILVVRPSINLLISWLRGRPNDARLDCEAPLSPKNVIVKYNENYAGVIKYTFRTSLVIFHKWYPR